MRKGIALVLVLVLTTATCTVTFLPVKAGPKTIFVPDDYASVQNAINSADRGDTVFVRSGTYNESLLISESIHLIGENVSTTVLTYPTLYSMFPPPTTEIGITAKNFEISNFTVENHNADGVCVNAMVNGTRITGNIIKGYAGLKVTGSNNTIAQNSILFGYLESGLSVQGNSNIIAGNSMPNSDIILLGDLNVITGNNVSTITLGKIDSPRHGGGPASSYNTVFGNTMGSVSMSKGTNNLFYENNLDTMTIGNSAENSTFYHNNFLGNSEPIVNNYNSLDSGNSWDNGKEGNYWNDYFGADADGDGIGDSPYVINANNQDRFPLMYPWGASNVTTKTTENSWMIRERMQQARTGLGVAAVNGKIYAIGGSTESGQLHGGESGPNVLGSWTIGGHVGTNEEYDPATNNWSHKASMPTPRILFATAVYQNKIYCIGGKSIVKGAADSYYGTNEVYDTTSDTWETKTSMPTARSWLTASVVNGKIYVIGGDPGTTHNEVYDPTHNEVYDPTTDTWTTKASMPALPYDGWFHVSAAFDNKIYVIGERLKIYDPETDKWSEGTSPPTGISQSSVAVATLGILAPKRIYVLGETNYAYNPSNDSWTHGADVNRKRYSFGVAVLNDNIYAIGGHTYKKLTGDFAPVAWNDQYTPFGYGTVTPTVHVAEPFPTVPVATASIVASAAIISTGLLVYFRKRKRF